MYLIDVLSKTYGIVGLLWLIINKMIINRLWLWVFVALLLNMKSGLALLSMLQSIALECWSWNLNLPLPLTQGASGVKVAWEVLLGAVVEVSIILDTEVRRFESKIQALALFALTLYLWAPLQLEQFMSLTRSWDSLVACITWQNEVMSVYWSEFNKIATLLKSLRNNRPQKMLRVLERLWKF